MTIFQIALLAIVQGAAELLPVSSSAHVIVAEKLMGLDPSAPELTFLLVMLHTGTVFAVILYFWPRWKNLKLDFFKMVFLATAVTGVVGLALKKGIESFVFGYLLGQPDGEVEHLFKNLPLMAASLFSVGLLILWAGLKKSRKSDSSGSGISKRTAIWIGLVQGLCLPFRGFSRSGATISTSMLLGVPKMRAEDFSFALAVVLTPPVIFLQLHRLMKASGHNFWNGPSFLQIFLPGLIGMVFSFIAGWFALKLLSGLLESRRWQYFGFYCFFASAVVLGVHFALPSQGNAKSEDPSTSVWVMRSDGEKYCAPDSGRKLAVDQEALKEMGVTIFESKKGTDGKMHAQACGLSAGKTNEFLIPSREVEKVLRMGYVRVRR